MLPHVKHVLTAVEAATVLTLLAAEAVEEAAAEGRATPDRQKNSVVVRAFVELALMEGLRTHLSRGA
jgi:uncharacterized protein with NAD-binding domain and iron-sulfur cluster